MSPVQRLAASCRSTARALGAWAIAAAWLLITPCASAATTDPIAGALTIVGSDTISALVLRWSDAFRSQHPDVRVQIQAPGSASAPIALLEGAADIGMMSRPMSADETENVPPPFRLCADARRGRARCDRRLRESGQPGDHDHAGAARRDLFLDAALRRRCAGHALGRARPRRRAGREDPRDGPQQRFGHERVLPRGSALRRRLPGRRRRLARPRRDRCGRCRQPRSDRLCRHRLREWPGQSRSPSRRTKMRPPWRPSWRMS